ncbi:MAG: transporter substrate-binding domain-containing protein, partial [Epsilonproteobacteria bacterium]|nr:transporter substrate-binding domain-containing protein [Campylobacterota bacterium]
MNVKFFLQLLFGLSLFLGEVGLCATQEKEVVINETQTTNKYLVVVQLLKHISDSVHYLQQERGAASGYVSSHGKSFAKELKQIQKKTDAAVSSLQDFVRKNQKIIAPFLSQKEQEQLRIKLHELKKLRTGIASLELTFAQIYSKYTQIIAYLLLDISNIAERCETKTLREQLYSYVTLLMYKESLGEKRAALSALFSEERFSQEIFEYFLTADTQEAIYFKSFLHLSDDEIKAYYTATVEQKTMQEVAAYEKLALEKMQGKDVLVKPEEWFESITAKIQHIQNVEEKLFEKITELASQMNHSFESLLYSHEKVWLDQKPVIRYAYDPDWKPLEWQSGISKHMGMIADVLKIVSQKSGITFKEFPSNSWREAYAKIQNGSVDMISAMAETQERKKYVNFTKNSVFSIPYVIVSLKGKEYSDGFDSLQGKNVAFVSGYVIEDTLKKEAYDFKHHHVKNVFEGMQKLVSGEVDALLVNLATANYFLNQQEYKDLQIAYRTKYSFDLKVALAKEYPQVALDVIDKALLGISDEQKDAIYEHWIQKYQQNRLQEMPNSKLSVFDILPLKEIAFILIILFVLSIFIVRFLNKRGSVKLGIPIFIFGMIFVVISVFIVVSAVSNLKESHKAELKDTLSAISKSTHMALREWYEGKQNSIEYTVLHTPKLYEAIVQLYEHKNDPKYLVSHQVVLEKYDQNVKDHFPDRESYFVVTKDYTVLGSSIKEIVGKKIKFDFAKKAIDNAFLGEITLIHPRVNPQDKHQIFTKLYFLIPLFDKEGKNVIAVYASGINPVGMIEILQQGQLGKTGETYVVNNAAELISQSRFDDELRELGLLKEGEKSFLNIKIAHNNKLTLAAEQILKAKDGYSMQAYNDYRGMPVFGSWKWDDELKFGLISEVDESEAMQSFLVLRETIYGTVFS